MRTRLGFLLLGLLLASSVEAAVLDSCVRSNEGPPLSSSWGNSWLGTGLIISSNKCVGNSDGLNRGGYWLSPTYTDVTVEVTLSTIDELNFYRFVELQARIVNPTSSGTVDGYAARLQDDSGGNGIARRVRIYRIDDGAYVALTDNQTHDFVDGDKLRFTISGSSLEVFWSNGGSWTSIGSTTDTTYSAAGNIGLGTNTGATKLTMVDFSATDLGGGGGAETFGFRRRLAP